MPSYLLEDTAKVERPATGVRQTLFTLVRLLLSWDYFGHYSGASQLLHTSKKRCAGTIEDTEDPLDVDK